MIALWLFYLRNKQQQIFLREYFQIETKLG